MIAELNSSAELATQLEQKDNRINQLEQQMTHMHRRPEWKFKKMGASNIYEQGEA